MIRPALCLAALAVALPAAAEEAVSLRDRLRALAAPPVVVPAPEDAYADEIAADLALIETHAAALFGADGAAAIALFTGPDCADCAAAGAELAAVLADLGLRATVLDVSEPGAAALMAALTLDAVPSYVMRDRLIRGAMPGFVLHRYLSDAD